MDDLTSPKIQREPVVSEHRNLRLAFVIIFEPYGLSSGKTWRQNLEAVN